MYNKKFNWIKQNRGEDHMVDILSAWVKWTIYDYLNKGKKDNEAARTFLNTYKAEDYKIFVKKIGLFDKFYISNDDAKLNSWVKNKWAKTDFEKFIASQGKSKEGEPICNYCRLSGETLGKFYNKVESNSWQRGMNFEIDRKHGRMKTYLPKEDHKKFIKSSKVKWEKLSRIEADGKDKNLYTALSEALLEKAGAIEDNHYLYLPAPYNSENCVFACYWCNNAKTDAFDDVSFAPIGLKIGEAIEMIVGKIQYPDDKNLEKIAKEILVENIKVFEELAK